MLYLSRKKTKTKTVKRNTGHNVVKVPVEKGGKSPQAIAPPPVSQKEPPVPPPSSGYLTSEQQKRIVETIRKIQADPGTFYRFQTGIDDMLKPHIQDPLVRAKLAIKITSYAKAQL